MKTGYDQFFKSARQAASGEPPRPAKSQAKAKPSSFNVASGKSGARFELTAEQIEEHLRRKAGVKAKRRRRRSFPWGLTIFSIVGVAATAWALLNADRVEHVAKNVEIAWMGEASANESVPAGKAEGKETAKAGPEKPESSDAAEKQNVSAADVDHLAKLNERKKELDAREQEIARQEAELAKQKEELERRLKELDGTRDKISEMLADRVKVDDAKIETLVQMYSNMKPPQAAKIFESMDEDLAVDILGRMKKKNAADIMNLLKSEKAQVFSEKYAGYKRLPASK